MKTTQVRTLFFVAVAFAGVAFLPTTGWGDEEECFMPGAQEKNVMIREGGKIPCVLWIMTLKTPSGSTASQNVFYASKEACAAAVPPLLAKLPRTTSVFGPTGFKKEPWQTVWCHYVRQRWVASRYGREVKEEVGAPELVWKADKE